MSAVSARAKEKRRERSNDFYRLVRHTAYDSHEFVKVSHCGDCLREYQREIYHEKVARLFDRFARYYSRCSR